MRRQLRWLPHGLALLAWRARRRRGLWLGALLGLWAVAYRRHERAVRVRSERERARLGVRDPAAVRRALESRGPGAVRSPLEADVRRLAPPDGLTVIVGSGDGSLLELVPATARAVGIDLSGVASREATKARSGAGRIFLTADASRLPVASGSVRLVVLGSLHRMDRPEDAVWEAARVLGPGGRVLLSVPSAVAAPVVRPSTHALVWLARMAGATRPWLVPGRNWTEPRPVERALMSDPDGPEVWMPRVEHVPRELEWLLRAAGFRSVRWRAEGGRFDAVPGLRRLGPRMVMEAEKAAEPVAAVPPLGIWPGATG